MSKNPLTHYCISCGEPFQTDDPKMVLCAACGGEPESSPLDKPEVTQAVPLPSAPLPKREASQASSDWQVGDVILDTYEVKGELGQGGFGKVYRVHHKSWNIDLAVKRSLKIEPGSRQSFIEEAEKWVDLGLHPNIVSCYYVRTIDDFPHTFAELAEGGSLEKWIRMGKLYEGQRLDSLKRILDIAIQFAWGLAYAHERGLVHQDVKPDNVLMGAGEVAKVTDFGLARARSGGGVAGASGMGSDASVSAVGGTVAYMSPEQSARQRLTTKTDLWSWGVSVLEMLTGEVTWCSGAAALDVLEDYASPGSELAADAKIVSPPGQLVDLLRQCFSYEPVQRPMDMQVVAGRLQEIYRREVGQAYPRQMPKSVELRADSLNNKALSLLDLSKDQDARQAWEASLKGDPQHLAANFNYGYFKWKRSEVLGSDYLARMEQLQSTHASDPSYWHLLAWVYFEQGNLEAIQELLAWRKISDRQFLNIFQADDKPVGRCIGDLQGHVSTAYSASISRDGRYALSGGEDKSVCLWEFPSGKEVYRLQGHRGPVNSVDFSPDGRYAVSASADSTLRLWDLSTGKQVRLFSGHTYLWCGRFSPDGRQIISGSSDHTVRLWNVDSGREVRCYKGHADVVTSVCFSSDARYILSGSYDRTLRLWEVETGKEVKRFTGHSEFVTSVCFSPDDRYALSSSKDRTIRLWEISTGKLLSTYQAHTDFISSVNYSPDGRFILFCSADSTLRLLEAKTWREIRRFEGHNQFARSVRFSPDGRYAVSTSLDGTLRFWEVHYPAKDYASLHPYPLLSKVRTFGRLADDKNLADDYTREAENLIREGAYPKAYDILQKARGIPGYDRQEKLLKLVAECATLGGARRRGLRDYWEVRTFAGHTDFIYAVSITPDSRTIISGGRDETIRIWDLTTGQEVRCLKGHQSIVLSIDVSPDGKTFLSGARDGTMRQWEVATGREIQRYRHNNVVFSVGYIPDSQQALSGCADRYMRLWDLVSNKELARYKHSNNVIGVCGLPGGRLALSSCSDSNLYLWDLTAGRQLSAFKGHTDRINSVSISPDGCYALSGSEDKTIRLWELKRGTEVKQFLGHSASVRTVRFSPDGLYALSGSNDKSICLWEIESGAQIKKAEGHTDLVNAVFVSRDGRYAVSGSADRTLQLWEFDWKWIFSGQGLD